MFRRTSILAIALMLISVVAFGAARQELTAAIKADKVAFVLVYDTTGNQVDQARQMAIEAARHVLGSVVIEVKRGDVGNADFVTMQHLETAPMPLIMVVSSIGIATGCVIAAHATVDQLLELVPSPKRAEIIKALSQGNTVFISVNNKTMTSRDSVNSICAAACRQMIGKSVRIDVDMDEPVDIKFLTEMKVNLNSTEPITLVANSEGRITKIYTGVMQVADLVTAATKEVFRYDPSRDAIPYTSCASKK